ncbi:Sodium/hydrogen exchanger family-domain-containing protein [Rhodocollybia butyracea]|uniref:Sodium/hydrogen exchanger family-domain-containing protein n=1 Tax=Rhodocollybia butyracea TaxID=206335 RepID=A0A9P5PYE2_9AGAR|nr:Sodium/hydrogen exchanger family-domain-containing protein [Rhodocollybia butyracea]
MSFHPFEVTIPHIIYTILGMFVVIFGMFSLLLREKLYIGEACWAFLFGIIVGPYGANIFNPRSWGNGSTEVTNTITLEFCRVVLAIGVFAIGVELPKAYMAKHWKSLFFLLAPIMTWGWFVSAAFIYALIPKLNFLSSLAVAACLTPTDPILAAAVVGGKYADKHVPAHLRHLLAAESGCNDGAAFPFLYIALYLILDRNTGTAIRDWFLLLWLYQVVLGIVIGSCLGFGFRHLMKFCERHNLIDRHSYIAQYISLALCTIGVTTLLGSDDLLSTFACGTAFAWDGFFNRQTEESVFSSVIDLLFNIAAFIFVGAWMPFNEFANAETSVSVWRLIVIAILVLLFRRLPAVLALYKFIPDIKTFREAIFTGHFGPMGIGAVFISTLAAEVLADNASAQTNPQTVLLTQTIQPITAFMVLCSITIHGLSIPSFSLGRRVHSVSRTWSRHTGGGELPEWADQTRRVTDRGEIVINRDREDQIERGEHTPHEKLSPGGSVGSSPTEVEPSGEIGKQIHALPLSQSPGSISSPLDNDIRPVQGIGGEPSAEVLPAGEQPPDGMEILSEWQEGPHRIIERRAGPGEEVEVEVIKNYDSPHADSSLFRGPHADAQKHLKEYLGRLRKAVDDTTSETRKKAEHKVMELERSAQETLEKGVDEVEHSSRNKETTREMAKEMSVDDTAATSGHRPSHQSLPLDAGTNYDAEGEEEEEEEEGWASDASGPGAQPDVSSVKKQRSKLPKNKTTKPRRRRNSIRRGLIGRVMKTTPSGSKPPVIEEVVERGRSSDVLSTSVPPSSAGSLRHHRIDSLKSSYTQGSREQSPARSVRFFDEPATSRPSSGATTPRHESFNLRFVPGTPPNEIEMGDDGNPARA